MLANLPSQIRSINLNINDINFAKAIGVFSSFSPYIRMLKFDCIGVCKSMEQFRQLMSLLPSNINSFDWGGLIAFGEERIERMIQMVPFVPDHVNFLKLNKWYCREREPLVAKVFFAIPECLKYLDLCNNSLHELTLEELSELAGSLPHITTLTLSYDEVSQMPSQKRVMFKDILPNIERILFVDDRGEVLNNAFSPDIAQFAFELGVHKVPSLLSICSFYAVKSQLSLSNTPAEVQEKMIYPIGNFFDSSR